MITCTGTTVTTGCGAGRGDDRAEGGDGNDELSGGDGDDVRRLQVFTGFQWTRTRIN